MDEDEPEVEDQKSGLSSGFIPAFTSRRRIKSRRAGFAIAPILYLLGLVGVGAAVLFSGYSQILRTNANITHNLQTKNDLNGDATTMAATSVLSADTTLLCPPTAGSPSVNCTASTVKLAAIAGQTQLPANTAGVAGSGGSAPKETGVFTAGSGMTQLDAWGHYYIVCRWENPTNPGSGPAFMIISGGPDGTLQTKCTDTTAQSDDLIIKWPVTTAINRSAVWQATVSGGSTTSVQFGQVGSQLVVDASGDLTVPGWLNVAGASTLAAVSASSGAFSGAVSGGSGSFSSMAVSGNETVGGTLGVTGATSLSTLSTSGLGTLNTAAVTGNATVGGTLGVTGVATLNSLAVTNNETVGGALGVTGDTNLASTLETGGLATLNSLAVTNNATVGGTLGVTGATSLSSLSTSGNVAIGGNLSVAGTTTLTGQLNGSSAVFTGTVQAANFVGTVSGGSIIWGSAIVPLVNGGTGYAATSVLDLLAHLGGTNASNLTLGTLPAGRIAAGEITSTMMAAPGTSTAGPYYQVYVDSAGRVTTDSTSMIPIPNAISDGTGESITADSNGLTFDTASIHRMRIDTSGRVSIGTTTAAVSLDLTKETDAVALPSGTTAQRPGSPVNGDIRYNGDTGITSVEAYMNGAWSTLATTSGSGIISGVILGTSTSATNPQRNMDATTGLLSPAVGSVAVSSAGTEMMRVNGTGVGIATSSIANALDVNGSLAVGTYAGTATGAANELIVGGNVGIKNASPGALLDIGSATATLGTMRLEGNTSGYVQIQPSAAAGSWTLTLPPNAGTNTYMLTTDGSGNTSWVSPGTGATIALGTSASATNPQRSGQAGTGLFSAATNTVSIATGGVEELRVDASGNVGIGTTTPSDLVQARKDQNTDTRLTISNMNNTSAANSVLRLQGSGATSGSQFVSFLDSGVQEWILGQDMADAQKFKLSASGAFDASTRLTVTVGGNVGIGTTAPGQELDVHAPSAGASPFIRISNDGTATGNPTLELYRSGADESQIYQAVGGGGLVISNLRHDFTYNSTIRFLTMNGTEQMRIDGSGLVGIGTTSPGTSLDISNKTDALALPSGTIGQRPGSPINGEIRYTQTASALEAYVNGAWETLVTSTGTTSAIYLGTSASATNPQRNGDATTGLFSPATNTVAIAEGGTQQLTVNDTGVGIGSTSPAALLNVVAPAQTVASASGANYATTIFTPPTITLTGTTHVTSQMNSNLFNAPTITDASAVTVDGAATLTVGGAPVLGGSVTLSNTYGLKVNAGAVSTATNAYGLYVDAPTGATNNYAASFASGSVGIGTTAPVAGGGLTIAPSAATSGTPSLLTITGPADTTLAASTEANDVNINLARQVQFATGNITNQRAVYIQAPTYKFAGASTITNAATVDISGPPAAGTNATITNPASLIVESGNVGIGTTSPISRLHVASTSQATGLSVSNSTVTGAAGIHMWDPSASPDAGILSFGDGTGWKFHIAKNSDSGATKFVTVQDNGNVGIGNTSPGAKLDIGLAGTTLGTMRLEGNTSGYVQIQPAAAAGSWTMTLPGSAGTANYVLQTDGAGVTNWVSAGSLGGITLGTSATATSPQRSGQAGTGLFSATSNTVSIADNGSDVMDVAVTGPNILGTITQGSYSIGYQINGNNAVWQDATNFNLAVGNTAFPTTVSQSGGALNGQYNVAVGYQALNANTTGSINTAVGGNALKANTTGSQNTAVGNAALYTNTTGAFNTAVGYTALYSNTTGIYNTAVGLQALYANTTGGHNVALGQGALYSNTTGQYSVALGKSALYANTTGQQNTAVGYAALTVNTTGTNNTILGYNVASATLNGGSGNILIGTSSAVDTAAAGTNSNLNIGNLLQGDMTNSTAAYNKTLYLQSTASGVDYLQIAGGAASAPGIVTGSAQGTDTNINLVLNAKGTGSVTMTGGGAVNGVLDLSANTNALALPSGTDAQRPSSAVNGMVRYNSSGTPALEGYVSGAWTPLTTGGSGATINLGTSAAATNPQRSGQAGTGLFSATTNTVSIAAGGTDEADFASGGLNLPVATESYKINGINALWQDNANFNLAVGDTALPTTVSQAGGGANGLYDTAVGYQALNANTTGFANTALGYAALLSNTTGVANTALGTAALKLNTTGQGNTATGYNVLQANTTGTYNTGIGYAALNANTTGTYNTAVGTQALYTNTTGSYNAAVGYGALYSNTTGQADTALGWQALYANTTGNNNTALGYGALQNNTTGGANTAMGYQAIYTNTTGVQNTAVGQTALYSNTTGVNNTAMGFQALYSNTTGQTNTAVGMNALYTNTTGQANTALGWDALFGNTTGQNNTAVGYQTLLNNTTGTGNAALGYLALNSNTTGIDNTAVGISALVTNTTGQQNTALGTQALYYNTTGAYNTAVGMQTLSGNTTGVYNVAVGWQALSNNTTGISNTAIGVQTLQAVTTGTNNTVLGYQVASTTLATGTGNILIGTSNAVDTPAAGTSNFLDIGNAIYATGLGGTLQVGIGTTAPASTFHVYSSANTDFRIQDANSLLRLTTSSAVNYIQSGLAYVGDSKADLVFTSMGAGTEWMRIKSSNGNIGIGSASPAVSLDLNLKTDAVALPSGTSGQRPSGINGEVRYNQTLSALEGYVNGAWETLVTGTGSTATVNLGTSAAATNPQRSGQAGTGLFSAASNTVSIAAGGTDEADFASTGLNLPVSTESFKIAGNNAHWQDDTNFNLAVGATGLPTTVSQAGGAPNGQYNSAIGYQALNANTTGNSNTAVGADALYSNTTGSFNTAVGVVALFANTTGTSNTGLGYEALYLNTTGNYNTAVGMNALYSNTTGASNTAIGFDALQANTTGAGNTALGLYALLSNTTGQQNTAVGKQALNTNTTGSYNAAVGYGALQANTTGNYNTAVGQGALFANTTGYQNTAVGFNALNANTTGIFNTAMGVNVLASNTTGQYNTVVGYAALYLNTTGAFNAVLGANALYNNTTGINNTAVGYAALNGNTTGINNTAMGYTALYSNTTGVNNTAVGYAALNGNTTGVSNTAMGYQALYANTTGINNTAVGQGALQSNTTGGSNTAVGINALLFNTTGTTNVAVGDAALYSNTTGQSNTAVGHDALVYNTTGVQNTAVGFDALQNNTTGINNVALGMNALFTNTTGVSNTAVGLQAGYDITTGGHNVIIGDYATTGVGITTGSNNILIGQNLQELTNTSSNQLDIGNLIFATGLASGSTLSTGNVGIGTTSPGSTLDIVGNGNTRTGSHASGIPLYVTGNLGSISGGVEFRHTNGSQGVGIGYQGIYATGSNATQDLGMASKSTGVLYFLTNASERMRIDGSGNVGIGTTAPTTNVQIGGTSTAAISITNTGYPTTYKTQLGNQSGAQGILVLGNNGTNEIRFGNTGAGGLGNIYVNNTADYSAAATGTLAATFSANGNVVFPNGSVGIGTTAPIANLTVGNAQQTSGDISTVGVMSGSTSYPLTIVNTASRLNGNVNRISFDFGTSGWSSTAFVGAEIESTGTAATALAFGTYNGGLTEKVRITSAGNVGIGSTSPQVSLDMNVKTDAVALPSGTTAQRPSGINGEIRYNQTLSALEAYAGGGWVELTVGGNVAINLGTSAGATDPQRSGEIGTGFFSAASGQVSVASSGTDVADFASTGLNLPVATETYKIGGNNAHWQDTTNYNLAVGYTALPTTDSPGGSPSWLGQGNVAVGQNALNANTTGFYSTAVGFNALSSNTTGTSNTAVGMNALSSNTTGTSNTAVGTQALPANTTGSSNVGVGLYALLSNTTGNYNTAVGTSTLQNNTTGTSNVALGVYALTANTTGTANTAVGTNALQSNTTAANNTAVGQAALYLNTTGTNNTALGANALYNNTTAANNTALGYYALFANTTGTVNTAVGQGALTSNTTGSNNTAVGNSALYWNTTGQVNTAVGYAALNVNTTGSNNTAVGVNALSANTTATNNTAVGYAALTANTTGVSNTAVGNAALQSNTTGQNNTAMGVNALYSNTTAIDNTALGYGALYANTTGYYNTALGYAALYLNTTGFDNTAVGEGALYTNTTGNYDTAVGTQALNANTTGIDNTAMGFQALYANTVGTGNTAVGYAALQANTTGINNTSVGLNSLLQNTTGTQNTAVGAAALQVNTTGIQNTAMGYLALYANTGNYNTAMGLSALTNNTTGQQNTAMGVTALTSNTTGNYNTAMGANALYANTTGVNNTAMGFDALYYNTTGVDNTAVGYLALYANTTGIYNTALGYGALQNNTTGGDNTAVGLQALYNNTTGSYNTAIGYTALIFNTTGIENTVVGYQALYTNTTGAYNTVIGSGALFSNTTGQQNTALGRQAMYANTSGNYNTAVGLSALFTNTTGSTNVAVGMLSLFANTTGGSNTAVGYAALDANTTANYNTAMGAAALTANTTGSNNTAMGYNALATNTTGVNNAAVGVNALYANTTGISNTAMGYYTLSNNTTGVYNTAVGQQALNANSTGGYNTALGAFTLLANTTGTYNAAVGHGALESNTTGSWNTGLGIDALFGNTTGAGNTAVGYLALGAGTLTGTDNTAIGYEAAYTGTTLTSGSQNTYLGDGTQAKTATDSNSTVIGYGAVSKGSNTIVFGNTSISALYAQVTTITGISDRRKKKDIQDADLGLDFIGKLRPVSYRYNNGDETLRYGFIAQDVEQALPAPLHNLVEQAKPEHGLALVARDDSKDHTYTMGYSELISPVVKAVQELKARDDKEKNDIADLRKQVAALSAAHAGPSSPPSPSAQTLPAGGSEDVNQKLLLVITGLALLSFLGMGGMGLLILAMRREIRLLRGRGKTLAAP